MNYDFQICNKTFSPAYGIQSKDKFVDTNALGFGWRPGQKIRSGLVKDCKIDGSSCSEGLKLSFVYDMVFRGCEILGGNEDCDDIVRGGNLLFENCRFVSQDSCQHITIKGGVKNVTIRDCIFSGNYKNWWDGACVDLGNWTDYDDVDRLPTRNINLINCKMENMDRRLLYRTIFAKKPNVENCDGRGFCIPPLFVKIFWLFQRRGWLGKRRKFPKGWLKVYDVEL